MKGTKRPVIALILIIIIFVSCKSECTLNDRMEGFRNGKLRVFVRVDQDDERYTDEFDKDIREYLLELGKRRAISLLIGYMRTTISDRAKAESEIKRIPDAVKDASLTCGVCNEEYCEAFIDYDVKALDDIIKE